MVEGSDIEGIHCRFDPDRESKGHAHATAIGTRLPRALLESRLDSAFFNEQVLLKLEELRVEYAVAVPFAASGAAREEFETIFEALPTLDT